VRLSRSAVLPLVYIVDLDQHCVEDGELSGSERRGRGGDRGENETIPAGKGFRGRGGRGSRFGGGFEKKGRSVSATQGAER